MDRRTFIKVGTAAASLAGLPVMAGPFDPDGLDPAHPVPIDKKLDAQWLRSLLERGEPAVHRGWDRLKYIGMPVGGIGCGTVYLGGDGRLWCWDVFNQRHEGCVPNRVKADGDHQNLFGRDLKERDGANYIDPPAQESPWNFDQGFAVRMGDREIPLDHTGFSDVSFRGDYPIGLVEYSDPALPLQAELEAFTPFIPLDTDSSSFPATIMRFKLTNTGPAPLELTALGWTENPALGFTKLPPLAMRSCRVFNDRLGVGVDMTVNSLFDFLADHGSLTLMLAGEGVAQAGWDHGPLTTGSEEGRTPVSGKIIGAVGREMTLGPGETGEAVFIMAWHFPNARIPGYPRQKSRRWYAAKFADARSVALAVSQRLDELTQKTRLFRDSWYGGSMPRWFLERTLLTVDALQTNTCHRFTDGRFWAWEGVGCCPGTCTHVWHYAQAAARLFPELERDLRERTDYGIALRESDGMIKFRGEFERGPATDGQAAIILRTLREHQMSTDDSFLRRVWPRCKLALQFLIGQDGSDGPPDGVLTGDQPNTLDASWFGKIPALTSLYLAALRAGEEMAKEMGDQEFASRCRAIYERGRENILALFDPEAGYFIQEEDPNHPEAIGVGRGCFIDQVIGQWWAAQAGLGRLFDEEKIRSALGRLWDYNFCPDMALVRDSISRPSLRGRPYAIAGDAGLVMCTWPRGGRRAGWERHWQYGYFNECMSGFEYQAAGHMIWEGTPESVEHGLAICRAIHDRYHPLLRNPYNEIECSDHYARAMASYGAFIAACGFTGNGPKGEIGFAPRLGPENFEAFFSAAGGWGMYRQKRDGNIQTGELQVVHGSLTIGVISLEVPADWSVSQVRVTGPEGEESAAGFDQMGESVRVTLSAPVKISKDKVLTVRFQT